MNGMKDVGSKTKYLAMMTMGLLLTSCSDESSNSLSFPEDMHTNERAIADTAQFDVPATDEPATLSSTSKVFETETELLIREQQPSSATNSKPTETPAERKAYFGDLHVHTTYSLDAYAFGTVATPYDAYRFAKGEAIANPAGFKMQLSRPMDFYAVTDHGMFLGVVKAAAETTTEFSKNEFSEPYHDLNAPENMGADLFSILKRFRTFGPFLPSAVEDIASGELDRNAVLGVVRSAWRDTIDAADQFNDPGNFTTFAAYEYTTFSADMGNLHRNVVFEGTDQLPREPFSRTHSANPEDLWQWMDELRAKGVESLAIPHNSNGSNGQMFKLVDWAGNPLNDDYAKQRIRNEPIVEITQIKGTSETHPILSSRDEWAGFEIMPYRVATNALSQLEGSYVRDALLNGITLEQAGMTNPYQFGFIGSSDTHTAASQNDESNFVSKLGLLSARQNNEGPCRKLASQPSLATRP